MQNTRNYGRSYSGFGIGEPVSKIDLHLHSIASGAATNWWVKALGFGGEVRESYTLPVDARKKVQAQGMDFTCLTDHETIDGIMSLAQHPDVLIGEELHCQFPDDQSKLDVLVYGITPEDHIEVQARRHDVYQLVDYLRERDIVYVLAHPLFEMGMPVTREMIERRMVLFPLWEFINGSRPRKQNELSRRIAESVDAAALRQMASKHGLPEPAHRRIAGTAGTDDHGGVYPGRTWTEVPRVSSVSELLDALRAGETRACGEHGNPHKMIASGLRLLGGGLAGDEISPDELGFDVIMPEGSPVATIKTEQPEIARLLEFMPIIKTLDEEQLFGLLSATYESKFTSAIMGESGKFSAFGLLSRLGKLVDAHGILTPLLGIHAYFGREVNTARRQERELLLAEAHPLKVAMIVDDLESIHGVATMYRHIKAAGPTREGDQLELITCGHKDEPGIITFRPITEFLMPFYGERNLGVPSLAEILAHVEEAEYDIIHISAPGPLGVLFSIAGAIYGIPVVGMYHTELAAYAGILSGDQMVEEVVDMLVKSFYQRCRTVIVPSQATGAALLQRGYKLDSLDVLPNGVDTARFTPDKRDDALRNELGAGKTLVLYAGRVSREKGLDHLADHYLALRERRDDIQLVIAGDGPYRDELQARLGDSATFTGFLEGDDLARVYASCDIFAFPSETDTLGRAVIEAQASGLPAVVFGTGGPRECVKPGESGFVVEPGDFERFMSRIDVLTERDYARQAMAQAARSFAESLTWPAVRDALVAIYRNTLAGTQGRVLHLETTTATNSSQAPVTAHTYVR